MNTSLEDILDEYNLDLDELRYFLDTTLSDCNDDIDIDEKGYCKEAKCFEVDIPACRKVIEIRKKFYPHKKIKEFAKEIHEHYLKATHNTEEKAIGLSSLTNYVSCKICTGSKNQSIKNPLFFDIICNTLPIKLDQDQVFNTPIRSVKQFKRHLIPVTKENFKSKLDKLKQGYNMTKEEQDRLYEMIHVSRQDLKKTLRDKTKTTGTPELQLNLALHAFERNLIEESLMLIEGLLDHIPYQNNSIYLQLHAKVLSSLHKDREAIKILEHLIKIQQPHIDTESHALLAASFKRLAFEEYEKNLIDNDTFNQHLLQAKSSYDAIFKLTQHYYPAINSIYLLLILAYFNNASTTELQHVKAEVQKIWSRVEIDNKDWWACISDVEFSILTEQDNALDKLEVCLQTNSTQITEFSLSSTIRQLELYAKFDTNTQLSSFINHLKTFTLLKNN